MISLSIHGCSKGQGSLPVYGGAAREEIYGARSMPGRGTGRCFGYHKRPESQISSRTFPGTPNKAVQDSPEGRRKCDVNTS